MKQKFIHTIENVKFFMQRSIIKVYEKKAGKISNSAIEQSNLKKVVCSQRVISEFFLRVRIV